MEILNPNVRVGFLPNIISSFFFSGYAPSASGTVASLLALLFFLIPGFYSVYILSPLIIISFILGIFSMSDLLRKYGDDPSVVVIDEAVGMWTAMLVMNLFGIKLGLMMATIAFLGFRFFDITKIYPASYFDRQENSFGVMMDDVVAGIYAGVASSLIILMFPKIV